MNILLIEDDAGLVELITAMLEELGFSVMSALSGVEALVYLKKQTPGLMLLDYSLPDLNGKELIETLIKQQISLPPFIITTGQGDERIAVDMMKLGAMDYLIKDILFLEKLPDTVKRVIKEIDSDRKLKHAKEALNQSTQLLETSQSIAKLGGWELDIATNNLFWTAETYRIHETSPEEFNPTVDTIVGCFLPESRRIISNALKAAIEDGKAYDLELEAFTVKGRQIDVRITCEVTFLDGKPAKLTGIFQDITQQKIIESELKIALEKALESDRLKSAFLANMSHEIRTPMNGILGFVNLLNEPYLSKSQIGEYSSIINKSGNRLLNTINDIIDISKIESGTVVLATTEICVNTEIEELYSFFLPEANKKGLSLSIEPSISTERLMVLTDSNKLHGILTNLIKNAIKYTKRGCITFGYYLKNDFIEFYIKDTGIGIPRDRLKAIFNRFEQADIGDKLVFEGSGLGLAISKAYVEMLGGEISVESDEDKGSKFTFTIPYVKNTENKVEEIVENIVTDRRRNKELNLLIVEDDEVCSEFLKSIMEGMFKKITFVNNGKDAVDACRDMPELDLVLMDIKIPILNGYDATKEIRKFNKDLLIIAQTAYALHGDKEKAIESGCNAYVAKPIDKILLLELIDKLLI